MFKSFRLRLNQKGVIHLIPLLLILAGIVAGVYLVEKGGYQIFRPRAEAEVVEFIQSSDSCVTYKGSQKVTSCPKVQFKLTSPLDNQTSDAGFSIVKPVYASHGPDTEDWYCENNKVMHSMRYPWWDPRAPFGWFHEEVKDCNAQQDSSGNPYQCVELKSPPGNSVGDVDCYSRKPDNIMPKGSIQLQSEVTLVIFKWTELKKVNNYRLIIDSKDDKRKDIRQINNCSPINDFFYCYQYIGAIGYNSDSLTGRRFQAGATYTWWVDALDDKGNVIGTSDGTDFTVVISKQKQPLSLDQRTKRWFCEGNKIKREYITNEFGEEPVKVSTSEDRTCASNEVCEEFRNTDILGKSGFPNIITLGNNDAKCVNKATGAPASPTAGATATPIPKPTTPATKPPQTPPPATKPPAGSATAPQAPSASTVTACGATHLLQNLIDQITAVGYSGPLDSQSVIKAYENAACPKGKTSGGSTPPGKCTFGPADTVTSTQAQCVLNLRPDILTFYRERGWCSATIDYPGIVNNWLSINSAQDDNQVKGCFEGSVPGGTEDCTRGSADSITLEQAKCVLFEVKRSDILPFYKSNNWCTDESNYPAIINNWMKINNASDRAQVARCFGKVEPTLPVQPIPTPATFCPVTSACCYQPLQPCGPQTGKFDGVSKDTSCPFGFQWCYGGYCINENYQPASGTCSTTPSEGTPKTTRLYRFAEDATSLQNAVWESYTQGGKLVTYTFKDSNPGQKFIFVQFQDDRGNIVEDRYFVGQIELIKDGAAKLFASCNVNKTSVRLNEQVTFQATAEGGTGNYNYSWAGDITGRGEKITKSFTSLGFKDVSVVVESGNESVIARCPNVSVTDAGDSDNIKRHEVEACQVDCGACTLQTPDQCGNTTYDTCDYTSCVSPDSTYNCYAKDNNNCQGAYRCGNRCATPFDTDQQ